jgi:hypothetical protein
MLTPRAEASGRLHRLPSWSQVSVPRAAHDRARRHYDRLQTKAEQLRGKDRL